MKTSKEMIGVIADKVRESIINGNYIYDGIQYKDKQSGEWMDEDGDLDFCFEYRIKPETIIINGVEIPKPLRDSEILEDVAYYHVDNSELLYNVRDGEFIADHGIRFVYETREQAIEASKALFGIE